jgi:hypothetical protein
LLCECESSEQGFGLRSRCKGNALQQCGREGTSCFVQECPGRHYQTRGAIGQDFLTKGEARGTEKERERARARTRARNSEQARARARARDRERGARAQERPVLRILLCQRQRVLLSKSSAHTFAHALMAATLLPGTHSRKQRAEANKCVDSQATESSVQQSWCPRLPD